MSFGRGEPKHRSGHDEGFVYHCCFGLYGFKLYMAAEMWRSIGKYVTYLSSVFF